ncbi:MAG: flavodoxin [Muribaculaceae bacterium]|nr:flavodoxin [Muribaculaceae bacterium]
MRTVIVTIFALFVAASVQAKTLVVYYSYTNNVERIVDALRTKIDADVLEIEPAQKGLDYTANNYAIGSAQIAAIRNNPDDAASYPAIDPVDVNLSDYDCIIVGAPLWWSNMAAPLQTFLFQYGKEMSGKKIGLIVSSASSGISGVEADAKRLIPGGDFLTPSLWIRSSRTSNAGSMLDNWLKEINYDSLTSGIGHVSAGRDEGYTVYNLSGVRLLSEVSFTAGLSTGIYIINGKKTIISK